MEKTPAPPVEKTPAPRVKPVPAPLAKTIVDLVAHELRAGMTGNQALNDLALAVATVICMTARKNWHRRAQARFAVAVGKSRLALERKMAAHLAAKGDG